MEISRLDDMLQRYGEICTQKVAGQILGVVPRTVARMMDEGRLRRVGNCGSFAKKRKHLPV